ALVLDYPAHHPHRGRPPQRPHGHPLEARADARQRGWRRHGSDDTHHQQLRVVSHGERTTTMSTSMANSTLTPTWGRSTLTSVFSSRVEARRIIDDLRAFGLRDDQIGVAMRDPRQQAQFIDDTGTHAADGAANAAATAAHGVLFRLMAGLRSNLLPGNPTIAAAPALAQEPVAPGGVTGALLRMHLPEGEARQRESDYHR